MNNKIIAMLLLMFLSVPISYASEYFGILIDGERNADECPVLATQSIASIITDMPIVNLFVDTQAALNLNCANTTLTMTPFYRAKLLVNTDTNPMKFDGILSGSLFSTTNPIASGSEIHPVMGSIVDVGSCLVNLESSDSDDSPSKLVTVGHSGEFRLCLKKAEF